MAGRSARIELRAEPKRERRIRYAAELANQSVSAFVLEAASERAETVIASASSTVVPAEFFDRMWKALSGLPRPNEALRRRAKKRRRVVQRS